MSQDFFQTWAPVDGTSSQGRPPEISCVEAEGCFGRVANHDQSLGEELFTQVRNHLVTCSACRLKYARERGQADPSGS